MDSYLKQRIETITEQDFWSSIKPAPGLSSALEAGRSGRRKRAYQLLGHYHAKALSLSAEAYIKDVLQANKAHKCRVNLRRNADRVLRHDIRGWHTQRIKFGPKIDFNADFGQSGQYGFHYMGWLIPVLNQYVVTRQAKYRDCFIDIIRQYYEQRNKLIFRIPSVHPVYYELGAGAKTRVILPAYALLAGDDAVDADAREAMLKLLLGFSRSLYRIQEKGYCPGNWQIFGCSAMYLLGATFPEFREAAAWRKRAETILHEHRRKDFFADGGHGERCWGYGWMSLRAMVDFYRTALCQNRLDGRSRLLWSRFLKKGFEWYAASISPSGHLLNYGDGGIGSAKGIFDMAYRLFPELKKKSGLLGVDRSKSNIMRPSGYAFMRGGDGKDTLFMSVNFGGWGGGHTHQDLLDFSLWCYSRPLIEEVGRFGSYDNPLDPLFRSEQSHNQIVLEHRAMNRKEHKGHDVLWHSTRQLDFFSAWHEAYERVRIHRNIVFVKSCYWVIYDVITAKEYIFQVSSYLHAPKPFQVLCPGRARVRGSLSCLVAFARPDEIRRVTTGVDYDDKDFNHPAGTGKSYGFAHERHNLKIMKWRDVTDRCPITFAMLLVPFKGQRLPKASIRPVGMSGDNTEQSGAFEVICQNRKDLLIFNPAGATLNCGRRKVSVPMAARLGSKWVEIPI